MALALGLAQLHWSGALVPRGRPTWGLTHRTTQPLRDQRGCCKVCWQLNQHLVPHLWHQPMQELIQQLSRRCIGYNKKTAVKAVYMAMYSIPTLYTSCPAITCMMCHINWVELLLEQSLKLAPG